MNNYFGKNLKFLLKRDHVKQATLADELGFDKRTVSAWVTGRNQPSIESLIDISYFFGVDIDTLIKINIQDKCEIMKC